MSISSLSKELSEIFCVNHLYLDEIRLMHCMYNSTRFLSAFIVKSASLDEAVIVFETSWIAKFWLPVSVQGDKAFSAGAFKAFLDAREFKFNPVPPRRHTKNSIESKCRIICSSFLKLQTESPDESTELHANRDVNISNDLYGNDVISSF